MIWWHAVLIAVAGVWAGMINTVVGSGTLVTFPVLVALGYPPVTATTSNAIGLAPGSISGAIGYRHELGGQWRNLLVFTPASLVGAIGGTILLLSLPPDAFETVVPFLIGLAVVLVLVQPRVSTWVLARREKRAADRGEPDGRGAGGTVLLVALILLIGVYGGYFTAAQGVMLMAVMGMLMTESLQQLNGIKNVLAAVVNVVAGAVYAFVAPISWAAVALLAVGSVVGGLLGARIGRKLSPKALRAVIVTIGVAAMLQLLLR
ncbi:sulfite exporter TauE/SafE family protein [Saccharomonospora iraqiensis]|uniref:sulfite exporter TauE/SafE family protein n=1 Tax=Saccharomonospora iraqiensis TaxID=52698 RepID=UPI00022E753D|nr:sulfite exporter TauE/SafE family protein [Saccharomonospora iraqiensis]